MALQNAREQLARRQAENSAQRELLEGVAETFGLETPPKRIEVYDNSHIQGTNALGGMIVAGPDGFEKGEYRKFNIKSTELTPGDDYGMMREVLTRRFSRLVKESESGRSESQMARSRADRRRAGPARGGAERARGSGRGGCDAGGHLQRTGPRRRPRAFLHEGREPFRLDPKSPVLYYLQRLRDEAHRFAIGSHRKKRAKAIGANPLDEIAGVGASRKRALLQHFGSARAVAGASLTDLEAVGGVSEALAKKIFDFFHPSA